MVANYQYAHAVFDDAEQKMKRKSPKIYAPEIVRSNAVSFRRCSCFLEKGSQLGVELCREFWSRDIFVIFHDADDVRGDLSMKLQGH